MKIIKLSLFIISLLLLFSFNVSAQNSNPIRFSTSDIKNKTQKRTYIQSFNLNKDSFLSMELTLNQPLITHLKELAPNLSEEELLKKGSFQFSFFVDNQLIHTENLNKGAGTKKAKTTQLTYKIPLVYPEKLDFWGWFMWLKFMKMSGGRDVLDEGKHELTVKVSTYINDTVFKTGKVLAEGKIDINVEELPYDASLIPVQKIAPIKDLKISKSNYKKEKIEDLNKKIAQGRFEHINGIVILKKGDVLIEEYFNNSNRESLHDPRSVGKTITSTITGIAIDNQLIKNEKVTIDNFYNLKGYKNYTPKKGSVTIESLLTMSSGFIGDDNDFSNPGNEEFMYPTGNWVKFALDLPMSNRKIGEEYHYFTAGVVVLGDILHKTVPNGLVDYADKNLFSPLGITNYKWEYTPQKVGNTAGGIRLRAIDFAKYGQLYKNQGVWNGKQIISKDWVAKSLSKQIKQPYSDDSFYGYLFWNKTYTIKDKKYEASFCTGNGGNKIFIFKDIPFVIVITASGYNLPYMHSDIDKMMQAYILPAIVNH